MPGPEESPAGDTLPDPAPLYVLVTGYGPFSTYEVNPSWLAVKPLHDTSLRTLDASARPIHITALEVPVTYTDVLSLTPGFHSRPPVLPAPPNEPTSASSRPPAHGFDFVLHVGVAGSGPMRAEKRGRKVGYNSPDAEGRLCPAIPTDGDGDEGARNATPSPGVLHRFARSLYAYLKSPTRGFGKGYEDFPEELFTKVNTEGLLQYLKETGFTQIVPSTDAGLYLCEFINYCSLAEAKRAAPKNESGKATPTLFLHCPPVDQPLSTQDVTAVLQKVVSWVCSQ
ncbi:uncharacterized protein B0H18DRAFT_1114191 [Fomitopsis serialis]|uniref:uncharacterized protein n=1 Tax=Fomitopsis serialis TaxID=139415 RepID=UPI00200889CC|nr:uncharacterized protein B0H18DRAFT_1114191 [Neoantrodia serialis]KAH9935448.1 hypothetical protein B0H18DRAFT_1114191 [Neoantrodia serialis]